MLWVAPVGKWTDEESVVWLSKLWKQQGSPATWACLTGTLAAIGQRIICNCIYLKPVQNLWAVTTSLYLSLLKRETFLFVLEFNYSYYISDKSYLQNLTRITINTFTSSCWASIFFLFTLAVHVTQGNLLTYTQTPSITEFCGLSWDWFHFQ